MRRFPLLFLLLAFAACGSDSTSPDPDPAPATGPATFTIPGLADIPVLHSASDGTLLGQALSDADGRATFDITAGDMLTIAIPGSLDPGGRDRLYTYAGVHPGDSLQTRYDVVATSGAGGGGARFVTLQGELPAHDLYRITSRCYYWAGLNLQFPNTYQVSALCSDEPFDIAVETRLNQNGTYVADQFAIVSDVAFDPSGTTVIDFTGLWRNDWQEITFGVPLPAFTTRDISMSLWPIRDEGRYQNLGDRVNWEGASNPPSELVTSIPPGFYKEMEMFLGHENFDGQWVEYQERVALDSTVTDITPLMPRAGIGAFPESDFDGPGRPRMTWTLDRGGIEGDAVELYLSWIVGKGGTSWQILLPPGTQSFELPELPEELADRMPPAPDQENRLSISVEFHDSSYLDGYDERRNQFGFTSDVIRNAEGPGTQLYVGAYFDTGFGVDKAPRSRTR